MKTKFVQMLREGLLEGGFDQKDLRERVLREIEEDGKLCGYLGIKSYGLIYFFSFNFLANQVFYINNEKV